VLTVIRYGGKTRLQLQLQATTAATRELAEELRAAFRKVIAQESPARRGTTIEP